MRQFRNALIAALIIVSFIFCATMIGCGQDQESAVNSQEVTPPGETVELPQPQTEGGMSLDEAIAKRRSVRTYAGGELSREQVGQLLWAAQGITEPDRGLRASPSAGALYPLEVYLLEDGILYRYVPDSHSLEKTAGGVDANDLASAALGQSFIAQAPVVFVITAVFERTKAKYGERGDRYVYIEVGHAAENLLLEAVAQDLGAVPVGAFDDADVGAVLGLPSDHKPLYVIPVGQTG